MGISPPPELFVVLQLFIVLPSKVLFCTGSVVLHGGAAFTTSMSITIWWLKDWGRKKCWEIYMGCTSLYRNSLGVTGKRHSCNKAYIKLKNCIGPNNWYCYHLLFHIHVNCRIKLLMKAVTVVQFLLCLFFVIDWTGDLLLRKVLSLKVVSGRLNSLMLDFSL